MKRLLPTSLSLAITLFVSGSLYALFGSKAEAYDPNYIYEFEPLERQDLSSSYQYQEPTESVNERLMRELELDRARQVQREMLELEISRQQYRNYCNQITNNPRAQQTCFDSMY